MMSTIPITEAVSAFRTNEDSKDRILFTLQIAVKQVQQCSSIQGIENTLSFEIHEVRQLCDSLDKTLLHGLKSCQKGYWPFVKEFTHRNTVNFLEELGNVHTELECGRFWLCLALSESSLESYFRSFIQNMQLVKKHYESLAILRDVQKMQLVLMLMAGLEYVPVSLDVENLECGSGISMFCPRSSFDSSSLTGSFIELSEYSPSKKVSQSSHTDIDYEVIPCESAVEATSDFQTKTHQSEHKRQPLLQNTVVKPKILNVDLLTKVSSEDLERISYYINMDTENDLGDSKQLEVVRTKVVRRTKRSFCRKSVSDEKISQSQAASRNSPELQTQSLDESNMCAENRLSKATTDSGLCLETPCSSDSDSHSLNCNDDAVESSALFQIGDFHRNFTITFSTPINSSTPEKVEEADVKNNIEERGVPEGQEDSSSKNDYNCGSCGDRLRLFPGSDGCDDDDDMEEISIYDTKKMMYFGDCGDTLLESKIPLTVISTEDDCIVQIQSKLELVNYVSNELDCLVIGKKEDLDLRVANNVLLYFLVEVYEYEEEQFHKLYLLYSSFCEGLCRRIYLLLTNKCIYLLKQGNHEQKFFKFQSIRYASIDYIIVHLNYQGFSVTNISKETFILYTADGELTRTIVSNMEVAIRRFIPKLPLPTVFTGADTQTLVLKKFLESQFSCEKSDVVIQHYSLVRWQDSSFSSVTPSGPIYQDFLMYRHKFAKENKSTPWQPAFFLLKGGVLYCMEEEHSKPIFFIQMWAPHCRGCRRVPLLNRPHAFEIVRSDSDSLQLAASDEAETSRWLQCFLQTVTLAGHFIDSEANEQQPCSIILSNDQIVLATEVLASWEVKCLAKTHLRDLVSIFIDSRAKRFLMMEFEVAEASKCTGDWIFLFETEAEKDKFLECVKEKWSTIFQLELHVGSIKDLYLRKKFRQTAEQLNADELALREFCNDN